MYRAIIIEDEQLSANLLEAMILDAGSNIEILDKCYDLPSGVKSIKWHSPDVVFLDIEMPVYSGIQLLEFFNPEEFNFNIIFTTASSQYAVKAFEMCAVDYLMKPIQEIKLKAAIDKLISKKHFPVSKALPVLQQNFQHEKITKIVVPIMNGFEILNLKDIMYLQAEGSYTRIYFETNTNMLVSKNLKHFEFILADLNGFIRIHRSFIANIHFTKKLLKVDGGTLLMENKTELPVSEDKIEIILEMLKHL